MISHSISCIKLYKLSEITRKKLQNGYKRLQNGYKNVILLAAVIKIIYFCPLSSFG